MRKGAWGAGDIGLNQVLIAATIVFAGRTTGGVIAFQTAFAFFLLPHAVLGHPVFTTLFPHLAARGAAGDADGFARDLAEGHAVDGPAPPAGGGAARRGRAAGPVDRRGR